MTRDEIIHHGAISGVTGSCHELRVGEESLLVDCGGFQGADRSPRGASSEKLEIEFPTDRLRALILTHCHFDHAGRIPWLLGAGFEGMIYCSQPSAALLPLVLEEGISHGITRNKSLLARFKKRLEKILRPVAYDEWQNLEEINGENVSFRLRRAGHILGSAYVEIQIGKKRGSRRVVFSGDLGAPFTALIPAPKPPYGCDFLALESTYGDRLHEGRNKRRFALEKIIEKCFQNRGVVLIPAFSLGRTQELLCELERIIWKNPSWRDFEVVLDSPLAAKFTRLFRELATFWDAEARRIVGGGRHPLSFEQLTGISSHAEHLKTVRYLRESSRPTIVISASGMCEGGRIVNYLDALVEDQRTDVLFCGYQARGTLGREILSKRGKPGASLHIGGKKRAMRCAVHRIGGFSAHADQRNLVNFVKRMRKKPSQISLVHGDENAKSELKNKLASICDAEIILPTLTNPSVPLR